MTKEAASIERAQQAPSWLTRHKIEIEIVCDPVPGAWHYTYDFLSWLMSNSYVQKVTLLEQEKIPNV